MTSKRPGYDAESAPDHLEAKRHRYGHALVGGDNDASRAIVDELIATKQSLGDIYARVIGPSLVSLGESWCRGETSVGEEKLATQIVMDQMDRLRALYVPPRSRSLFRVMIACVEGEAHMIGARMIADLCSARGWGVDFLGPNVPGQAIFEMVQRRQPQVLGLSLAMAAGIAHAQQVVDGLARLAPNIRVVVGGQALMDGSMAKVFGSRCAIARDALTGIDMIGQFLRADRPKSALKEYQLVLARRVRDLRTKRGWTQEHLAEVTQVARACVIAIEGGKQNVSMDILVRMANALEVAPETLLSAEE